MGIRSFTVSVCGSITTISLPSRVARKSSDSSRGAAKPIGTPPVSIVPICFRSFRSITETVPEPLSAVQAFDSSCFT